MTDTPPKAPSSKDRLEFPPGGERIAKYLARAGICSRRDAEKLIEDGRVVVDGNKLDTPAFKVTSSNRIVVDGVDVQPPQKTRLWRYHKPQGLVTTARDPEGRPTVFEKLPPELPRVISIGRLDITSEGLLLLTNDGELARRLELPTKGWLRRYRVRVWGSLDDASIAKLKNGITVDDIKYGEIDVARDEQNSGGANQWLTVSLREGKNREVRRVLAAVGLDVNRLIRLSYGPFQLGDLPVGATEEVPARVLKDQIGRGPQAEMPKDRTGTAKRKAPPKHGTADRTNRTRSSGPKSSGPKSSGTKSATTKSTGPKSSGPKSSGTKSGWAKAKPTDTKAKRSSSGKPRAGGPAGKYVAGKPTGGKPVGSRPAGRKPGKRDHANRRRDA